MKRTLALCSTPFLLAACGELTSDDAAQEALDVAEVVAESEPVTSAGGVVFRFAGLDDGAAVLTREDLYTAQIQAREAGIRAQDANVTTFEGMRAPYAGDVLEWTDAEREALTEAMLSVVDKVSLIDSLLPEEVLLVKTGSVVEGGLPHTRSNAIIFAGGGIPSGDQLTQLFLHELHHVLSRANEDLHDDYFSLIGFVPCAFEEPDGLRSPRLSNPDAPVYLHYSPAELPGADGVIPFLHATRDYDGEGVLPNYFGFGLVPVTFADGTCTATIDSPEGLLAPGAAPDFLEKLGGNTGYIIHPEETLADNFVHWAMEATDLTTPELPEAVGAFWVAAASE